jgi:ribose/xylose/arabinose/galactoside ABC-type transport system permease subunit
MNLGRVLVGLGLVLVICGAAVMLLERLHIPFGRLPGDFVWRGRNTSFYFPLATCLVLSVLASLVMWLLNRKW